MLNKLLAMAAVTLSLAWASESQAQQDWSGIPQATLEIVSDGAGKLSCSSVQSWHGWARFEDCNSAGGQVLRFPVLDPTGPACDKAHIDARIALLVQHEALTAAEAGQIISAPVSYTGKCTPGWLPVIPPPS